MAVRITYPALENYTRDWGSFSVDKNLQDDWLIRLNKLKCFYVMGICEGHFSCDDNTALIVLGAKNSYRENLILGIERASELLKKYRDGSSQYSAKVIFDFPSKFPERTPTGWLFTLSFACSKERTSLKMDKQTEEWFVCTVQSIEKIDTEIARIF